MAIVITFPYLFTLIQSNSMILLLILTIFYSELLIKCSMHCSFIPKNIRKWYYCLLLNMDYLVISITFDARAIAWSRRLYFLLLGLILLIFVLSINLFVNLVTVKLASLVIFTVNHCDDRNCFIRYEYKWLLNIHPANFRCFIF